jgi:hypothetical protein
MFEGRTPEAGVGVWSSYSSKMGIKASCRIVDPGYGLSHVHKVFSRVITNRVARRLDEFQPSEQAGLHHIHTVRQIIQKIEEYNQPLCLVFVDYEKAFVSVEVWFVLESLQRCQVIRPNRLAIHPSDDMPVRISHRARPSTESANKAGTIASRIETRGRHLPKTVYECNAININGEYISHLRFADDIVIVAETLQDLQLMLDDLADSSVRIGLQMILEKPR